MVSNDRTQAIPSLPGLSRHSSGNRKTVRTITVTTWAAGVSLVAALGLGIAIGNTDPQPASAQTEIGTATSIVAPVTPGK